MRSDRIGHFAGNTELYLCERDAGINVPNMPYSDIFYLENICNKQLAKMWKRELLIAPVYLGHILMQTNWLINTFSKIFPVLNTFLKAHLIGSNINNDRDVYNLLDQTEKHIEFTNDEEAYGQEWLQRNDIPSKSKIVLLMVRDDAYLNKVTQHRGWEYHNYRDCDIDNFVLAAENLANMGFYVFRMGFHVNKELKSENPLIIDYATNGMRDDFMDIYLSSICKFIISTGHGAEAPAAYCFRKPRVMVDYAPTGNLQTFSNQDLFLTKHHIKQNENRELKLSEIFSEGVGFCRSTQCYRDKSILLKENTPEEINDIVVEMVHRLEGNWISETYDETLQKKFWEIFPTDALTDSNQPVHGKIKARFGAKYLRDNTEWIG